MLSLALATRALPTKNIIIVFCRCSIDLKTFFANKIINGLIYFLQFRLILNYDTSVFDTCVVDNF